MGERETTPGRVTWLSSGPDEGPDVGIDIGLGNGRRLYIGEMPRATVEESGIDLNRFPDVWWVTLYDGDWTRVVAAVADQEAARALAEAIDAGFQAARSRGEGK